MEMVAAMDNEILVMISLIEEEYPREDRNTPMKMRNLIKKEFDMDISPTTIQSIVGIDEDYERENKRIEYG